MTPDNFAMWLQGFAELNAAPPTPEQWQSIREHLATVFKKVTPPVAAPAVVPNKPLENATQVAARIKRELEAQPQPLWHNGFSPRAIC